MTKRFASFDEFWPDYLREHSRPGTRMLHYIGTLLAAGCLLRSAARFEPAFAGIALLVGYGFAWLGHAIIERNRPMTFSYPWWSLRGDIRMCALWLRGRLGDELGRHGIGAARQTTNDGAG